MLLRQIAMYAASDAKRVLPADVLHHAKRAVLDWLAALYAGTRTAPGLQLIKAHADELGAGPCSLPGYGTTTTAATAAWINGSVSHAVEFDDIYRDAIYHPGCPTIAAGLAVAELTNASGLALLNAVVVGYEISTRIGTAIQPSHYRFFHTTGTVGCFGSAAAASVLLSPGDADTAQHALATAATFASGLQQAFRSDAMTKALHAGHAAAVGVRAAQGAAHGVTGVIDILEGAAGFGAALSDRPDWARATEGLGSDYNITRITQKNHGCCGHTFAAIDAILALRSRHRLRASQVRSIEVYTYQTALDVTGNFDPRTAFEGKFSLPYVVCNALVHGSVRLAAFEPERLVDPVVRDLMARFSLRADAELSKHFPAMRAARVVIIMNNGEHHEHFAPYRKGDPEAPLSDRELEDKFHELTDPVLGSSRSTRLRDLVWNLDRIDVKDLDLADGRHIPNHESGNSRPDSH